MHSFINEPLAWVIPSILGFVGFMFDVPVATLWTAAFGTFVGLAFNRPTSYKYGFVIMVVGTFSVGLLVPIFTSEPPRIPEKTISFLVAVILISGRNLLPQSSQDILKAGVDRCLELIKFWRPKA